MAKNQVTIYEAQETVFETSSGGTVRVFARTRVIYLQKEKIAVVSLSSSTSLDDDFPWLKNEHFVCDVSYNTAVLMVADQVNRWNELVREAVPKDFEESLKQIGRRYDF